MTLLARRGSIAAGTVPSPEGFNPFSTAQGFLTPVAGFWAEDPDWTNPGDGNPVSSVRNVGGGGDPSATGDDRPTFRAATSAYNNKPTIEFGGSHKLEVVLSSGLSVPLMMVIVGNTAGANSTAERLLGTAGGTAGRGIGDTADNKWGINRNGTILTGGTCDSNPHVFIGILSSTTSRGLWVDGVEVIPLASDGSTTGASRFNIGVDGLGSSNFLTGHVAFVGFYDAGSRGERTMALEAALAEHYGITL